MTDPRRWIATASVGIVGAALVAWLLWPTERCISTLVLPADKNRRSCVNVIGLPADETVPIAVALICGLTAAFVTGRVLRRWGSDR